MNRNYEPSVREIEVATRHAAVEIIGRLAGMIIQTEKSALDPRKSTTAVRTEAVPFIVETAWSLADAMMFQRYGVEPWKLSDHARAVLATRARLEAERAEREAARGKPKPGETLAAALSILPSPDGPRD